MHSFHTAYSGLPPARPLWHVVLGAGLVVFVVGFFLSSLSSLLMESLPKKPRQPGAEQCACNAHDAAHHAAYDSRFIGLAPGGLGLAVEQAHLPLHLGQQPLGAIGRVAALPLGQLGVAPARHGIYVQLPQLLHLCPALMEPRYALHGRTHPYAFVHGIASL